MAVKFIETVPNDPADLRRFEARKNEIAVLTVNGQLFRDWETVSVTHTLDGDPPFKFRFTCSEGHPLPQDWNVLRIQPGMKCTVTLAGHLAISGSIKIRQVHYDAKRHSVELQGTTSSFEASGGSINHPTGEFKDVTLSQLARKVLDPLGIKFVVKGVLPNFVIPRATIEPGEAGRSMLERYFRMAGARITSNPQGDFVVLADFPLAIDTLIEGINIKEGREIIQTVVNPTLAAVGTQGEVKGTGSAAEAFRRMAKANQFQIGGQAPQMADMTLSEAPATSEMLRGRAGYESKYNEQHQITVTLVVLGWERPGMGGLWVVGQKVHVRSPMLILNNTLNLRSVTFEQSNQGGSTSTLELVDQFGLRGARAGRTSPDTDTSQATGPNTAGYATIANTAT